VTDPRERDAARRHGWTGPLRGELAAPEAPAVDAVWPGPVPEAVQALVPGGRVAARPARRTLLRLAMSGMPDTADLVVEDWLGSFRVRYPDRPELMVEELARVVDVAIGMRRRFGPALAHTKLITIDYGQFGFRTSHFAGMATPTLGDVHLNASLFLPEELDEMQATVAARGSRRPPQRAGGVLTRADLVTAHELWHQLDIAFTSRQFRAGVEFRRQLGAYFGVATLEHVLTDRGEVRARLASEVSAYATTNVHEAVAELGALWWCTLALADPPPIARHFGEVVDRFFPAPATPPQAR
jgi:hypothetical protein